MVSLPFNHLVTFLSMKNSKVYEKCLLEVFDSVILYFVWWVYMQHSYLIHVHLLSVHHGPGSRVFKCDLLLDWKEENMYIKKLRKG